MPSTLRTNAASTPPARSSWDWYRLCANGSGSDHGHNPGQDAREHIAFSPLATESGYEEFRADYKLILSHIGCSYSRNRGLHGVRRRTVTTNHVNLVAWHGTSAKQLASLFSGDRLSLEWITPKAGVDRLAVAKKQKSDTCVEETHTVNAEKSSPLAPPDSESQA
ncbi:hypothetical protein V8E53_012246 [Lactarius tabidus]